MDGPRSVLNGTAVMRALRNWGVRLGPGEIFIHGKAYTGLKRSGALSSGVGWQRFVNFAGGVQPSSTSYRIIHSSPSGTLQYASVCAEASLQDLCSRDRIWKALEVCSPSQAHSVIGNGISKRCALPIFEMLAGCSHLRNLPMASY